MIFKAKLLLKRFKYLKIPKTSIVNFLRVFAYFLSLCGLIFYCRGIFVKYFVQPDIGVSEKFRQAKEIPFPAITICSPLVMRNNLTNLKKFYTHFKQFGSVLNLSESEQNFLSAKSQVCSAALYEIVERGTKNRSEFDFVKLIDEGGPSIDETFAWCASNYIQVDCKFILRRVLTDLGMCFTFNMQSYETLFRDIISSDFDSYKTPKTEEIWTLDKGFSSSIKFRVPYRANNVQSFQFIMEIDKTEQQDLCFMLRSSFKVLFHLPNEIPSFLDLGEYIRFEREFIIKLEAQSFKASESLRKYGPEARGCYFEGERVLKYFKTYTKTHCNIECLSNFTLRRCGCTQFSLPHSKAERVCDQMETGCYLRAYYNWPELDEMSNKTAMPCECLPPCSDLRYSIKEEQVVELNEKSSMTIVHLKASKNVSRSFASLNINFGDFHVYEYESYTTYTLENFIADVGGLLSLFLGFSFTAMTNLVYRFYNFIKSKKVDASTKIFNRKINFNEVKKPLKNSWMEQIDEKDLIQLIKWQSTIRNKSPCKPCK